ncbi:MAG: hypothetical protein AAF436_15955 [Myxococcota bacterium]
MVWPQIRTALIFLHVLAVLVLALPGTGRMLRREVWESEIGQHGLRVWAKRLSWLGYETKDEFEADLWSLTLVYADANDRITRPFRFYRQLAGVRQGWAMFSSPQQYPIELHVDMRTEDGWEPIYRPLSDEHDFWAKQLRHHRTRKMVGRHARGFRKERYDGFARTIGEQAAHAYPEAQAVLVRIYSYTSLPPEDVRRGLEPQGKYEHRRLFRTSRFR